MDLKDKWKDIVDGVDEIKGEYTNQIAHSLINVEDAFESHIKGEGYNHSAKDINYSGDYWEDEENVEDAINYLGGEIGNHGRLIAGNFKSIQKNTTDITAIKKDIKASHNIFANALKGSATGEKISLKDISPVEHIMDVKVRSKNFLDIPNYTNYTYTNEIPNIQGTTITVEKIKDGVTPSIVWELGDYANFVGKTLTVSCQVDDIGGADSNSSFAIMATYNNPFKETAVNVHSISIGKSLVGKKSSTTFTIPAQANYVEGKPLAIRLYLNQGKTIGDYLKVSDLQVEEGSVATAYAPYIEDISTIKLLVEETDAEYTVNEDGTVTDVKSIYPNMTLSTDTVGAVIDVEYSRDINKAFAEMANAIIALGGTI